MPNTPLFSRNKKSGDYLTSKIESTFLARSIEKYYTERGIYGVSAWVEEQKCPKTGFKLYSIRSNIKFKVPSKA